MAHAKMVSILAMLSLGTAPTLAFPLAARIDGNAAAPLAARAVAGPDTTPAPEVNKRAGIRLGFSDTTITLDDQISSALRPLPTITVSLFRRGPLDNALVGQSELLESAGLPSRSDNDDDDSASNKKRLITFKDLITDDETILDSPLKLVPGLEDDNDDSDGTKNKKRDLMANTNTLSSILEGVGVTAYLGGKEGSAHTNAGKEKRQLGLEPAVDNVNNDLQNLEVGSCDLNIPLLGECRDDDDAVVRKRHLDSSKSREDSLTGTIGLLEESLSLAPLSAVDISGEGTRVKVRDLVANTIPLSPILEGVGVSAYLGGEGHTNVVKEKRQLEVDESAAAFNSALVDAEMIITTPFHPGYLVPKVTNGNDAKNQKRGVLPNLGVLEAVEVGEDFVIAEGDDEVETAKVYSARGPGRRRATRTMGLWKGSAASQRGQMMDLPYLTRP